MKKPDYYQILSLAYVAVGIVLFFLAEDRQTAIYLIVAAALQILSIITTGLEAAAYKNENREREETINQQCIAIDSARNLNKKVIEECRIYYKLEYKIPPFEKGVECISSDGKVFGAHLYRVANTATGTKYFFRAPTWTTNKVVAWRAVDDENGR